MATDPTSRFTFGQAIIGRLAARQFGLLTESGIVAGVVVVLGLVVTLAACSLSGTGAVMPIAVAAGVSLLAAELALGVGRLFKGPAGAMYGMLAGMSTRLVIAAAAALAWRYGVGPLSAGEMLGYLLLFYLATLATETMLLLAHIPPASSSPKGV